MYEPVSLAGLPKFGSTTHSDPMKILSTLEGQSRSFWAITGLLLIAGVGLLDFFTGYEIAFSLFYLLPISLVTWFTGRRLGATASIVSGIVWLIADIVTRHPYSHPAIYSWNSAIRFGFFIIVTLLLSALRKTLEQQKELARTDSLTGAYNGRFFYELVQSEIDSFERFGHPFTVVYVDLDNFKTLNDNFGHSTGDKVLYTFVKQAKGHMRKIDVVARLGGDEFAFLLPETDPLAAQFTISRLQSILVEEMRKHNWPVTFSMGVVTCMDMPETIDKLMKQADDLMYSVKNNDRNGINYSIYTD